MRCRAASVRGWNLGLLDNRLHRSKSSSTYEVMPSEVETFKIGTVDAPRGKSHGVRS